MRIEVTKARGLMNRSTTAAAVVAASVVVVALILAGHMARGQQRSADVSADVRIAAQRLEDGDILFGLRARDTEGEWSEPLTPRAHRLDPATARVGRWLVSSTLILEVDDSGRGRVVREEHFTPRSEARIALVSGQDGWAGDAHISAYHDDAGDLITTARIYSASAGAPDGELRTTITCQNGATSVGIGGLPSDVVADSPGEQVRVAWSVDEGTRSSEGRAVERGVNGTELVQGAESSLAAALLGDGSQLSLSIGTTPPLTTAIDLDSIRSLPIYDNLRYCSGVPERLGNTALRIRAQVRADGRIEFAVQQRTDDGWSENILPRARVIPAVGEATNWLSSTPVSVNVALGSSIEVVLPGTVVRRAPEPITPVMRNGYRTTSLAYGVYTQDIEGYYPTKLNSVVVALSEQGLQLRIECLGDERRVLLADAPSDSSGDLTLSFDDTLLLASWNVIDEEGFTSLAPSDIERTIHRLRQAQSLSVKLGHGHAAPVTFDLVELFATPIQANIDQCGSYTAPVWQPVTAGLFAQSDYGEYYSVSYPEANNLQRVSQVRVVAVEGTPAPGADRLDLVMTCASRGVSFGIYGLPAAGQPESIGLRIDGGEWFAEPIRAFVNPDGTASIDFITDLSRLQQGRLLEFDYGLEEPAQGAFDLTNLLGTPIRTNFDNCGRDYWPPSRRYVPVVAPQTERSRYLSYVARENEDGTVSTSVTLNAADELEGRGTISLQAHCFDSSALQTQVIVPLAAEAGALEVSLTIDDRPTGTSTWTVAASATRTYLYPPSNTQLWSQLRRASVAIVEAPGVIPTPISFQLAGMLDTPVQGNLDECGYYQPDEVRRLPLPLNAYDVQSAYDPDRDLAVIRFWERIPGRITPSTTTLEQHHREGSLLIGLATYCGSYGVRLAVYGSSLGVLQGDHVQVEWSTDGATTQQGTWRVEHSRASNSISPLRARAIMTMWRQASELELKLSGVSAEIHHFDLEAMFDIPIVETIDECLAAPFPVPNPLVSGIPVTVSGELTFLADVRNGSSWLITHLSVRDSGEAPEQPDEQDTRSSLNIGCGSAGLDLWLADLDVAESTFIHGDSVDVTWTIDGHSRSGTWSAWTQSLDYAISPRDDLAFYEELKSARTLTIRIDSDPPISKTYELAKHGFWGTPVQPNLDACGE